MKSLKLLIERVPFELRIGVNPGEKDAAQGIELDIELELPVLPAGAGLEHTVDYAALTGALREQLEAEGQVYDLLEHLCADVYRAVSRRAPHAHQIRIRARKPSALGGAGVPSVLMEGPPEA